MLVSQVLKDKGDVVFTASPHETLSAAAAMMHRQRIGAVVVVDANDAIVGILTERDVVQAVAEKGAAAATAEPISTCMTKDVVFAAPNELVQSLLLRMTNRRTRHLPVVNEGRLVGIVSIGDLVKSKIAEADAEADALKAYIVAG
jgi:CBS domain-containing protein